MFKQIILYKYWACKAANYIWQEFPGSVSFKDEEQPVEKEVPDELFFTCVKAWKLLYFSKCNSELLDKDLTIKNDFWAMQKW